MIKRIIALAICFVFLVPLSLVSVGAITPIDPAQKASLTICYRNQSNPVSGLDIKTYRVAEVFPDGTFALIDEFKDYPVNIYGITDPNDWKTVASTLSAYIASDKIEPTKTGITDENGEVYFGDIQTGIYLTLSVKLEGKHGYVVYDSFLTLLPYSDDGQVHDYTATVYPKSFFVSNVPETISYKVVKQWRDYGHIDERPKSVTVMLIKDGVYQSTQILSPENDWCYTWEAPNDGSDWQVIERNVPDGYTVTISKRDFAIYITNTMSGSEDPPQTGDVRVFWPYIVVMCGSGCLMILLALWYKRKQA